MRDCGAPLPDATQATIASICEHYRQTNQRLQFERLRFSRLTMHEAIERAAKGQRPVESRWIRCAHHTRKPRVALHEAARRLLALDRAIAAARDFDALHELVGRTTSGLKRLGPLYRYDVAPRIGHKTGVAPNCVYLHAGTRTGAAALDLDVDREKIPRQEFPAPLSSFTAAEIEDILCIYKERFATLRA
ncbi:MAG TPA: hypothetical protein VI670_17740 [Thermoanaerobaculia bacterium]|jgi:hypothetical protein